MANVSEVQCRFVALLSNAHDVSSRLVVQVLFETAVKHHPFNREKDSKASRQYFLSAE